MSDLLLVSGLSRKEIFNFFKEDQKLCDLALPDETLEAFTKTNECLDTTINPDVLGVYLHNELVLVCEYSYFTNTTISAHPYLKSKYHSTKLFNEIHKLLINYFINNTKAYKLITMPPESCVHIHKVCEKHGWTLENRLPKAIRWRGQLCDMLIYMLTLREE